MSKIHELRPPAPGLPPTKVVLRRPVSRIQHFWQKGRFYEEKVLKHVYRNYSGGVFVDCGSSIGNHTLFFGMYCKPDFVVSIEPVLSSVKHQRENLLLNRLRETVIFNMALSDESGTGKMVKMAAKPNARWPWNEGMWELAGGDEVVVATLDGILAEIPDVTLVKLDLEGYELKALAGATQLLKRDKPVLLIEAYPEKRAAEFIKFLRPFGYERMERVYKNMFEFKS